MLVLVPWLREDVLHIDSSVTSAIGEVVRNDSNHSEGYSRVKAITVCRKVINNNEAVSKEVSRPSYILAQSTQMTSGLQQREPLYPALASTSCVIFPNPTSIPIHTHAGWQRLSWRV